MQIYLPIAEMSVDALSIIGLGGLVGFLSGVFGVGGGFLTTPFLIFMGIPPAIAVGTQANQLVAAGLSTVLGHWRRGNVDLRIGAVMMAGGLLGTVLGTGIFRLLQFLGQIDLFISLSYVVLLSVIGCLMLYESVKSFLRKRNHEAPRKIEPPKFFYRLPYKMRFPRSRLYISALVPAGIGFIGGVLTAIMGIGGGFLLVPMMIYLLGMPGLLVAGTSMFQVLFVTMLAAFLHALTNHTVDLVLALLLIAGGVVGAQIGVQAGRYIKGERARVILSMIVLVVGARLAFELLLRPEELYSTVVVF